MKKLMPLLIEKIWTLRLFYLRARPQIDTID